MPECFLLYCVVCVCVYVLHALIYAPSVRYVDIAEWIVILDSSCSSPILRPQQQWNKCSRWESKSLKDMKTMLVMFCDLDVSMNSLSRCLFSSLVWFPRETTGGGGVDRKCLYKKTWIYLWPSSFLPQNMVVSFSDKSLWCSSINAIWLKW